MGYAFNADEIFELACQLEKNGAEFYRRMSENVKEGSLRKMLLDLASMEQAHEKVFEIMRKDVTSQEQEQTVFDPEGETALYLKAMADIHVFDKSADKGFSLPEDLSEKAKITKIFRAAIDREWASISFYTGIKEFVPEALGKTKIDDVIKEEMRHVTLLSKNLVTSSS